MNLEPTSLSGLFQAGNYAAVALHGRAEEWQTHAALGLVGKAREAIDGLGRFESIEARFFSAVASWIDGDEAAAARGLEKLDLPHAQKLLALIRKPRIHVLAQLDRGSQWDFISALQRERRFAVQNVGFRLGDLPNKPEADIRQFYDPASPPDFYIAKLVEWHVLPPNLQELPCPSFGHTADYDLHIQTVHPWLQLFDELVVTDPTEWADVSRLVSAPVVAFPKAFGLSGRGLPPLPAKPRSTDVFISGTALHPYHPDKAQLLHQVLDAPELDVKFINGFLSSDEYLQLLGQTKVGFTYVRHAGAMPTRGLESLAMGAAIAVQEGSVLQLFVGEQDGVVTYDLAKGNLPDAIRQVLARWPEFEQRARRGAATVRREFDLARVASQYFRFLTFLAAKPRGPRQCRAQTQAPLDQKRSVLLKGWVQSPWVNRRIRQQALARCADRLETAAAPRVVIDMARELMLEYATAAYAPVARDYSENFQVNLTVDRDLLTQALRLYRLGVERFPDSLVLRFNWIRSALHFGEPEEVTEALSLAEATLRCPLAEWQIDVMDDVFPWDFLSQFFNYRAYFDLCTLHLQTGEPVQERLARLLAASLNYYLSFYPPGPQAAAAPADQHALQAAELDPAFPFYKLQCARQLARLATPEAGARAAALLVDLVGHSMLFLPAFDLLERLRAQKLCNPPEFEALAAKVGLAQSRIHYAAYGVEDWEAVPLRMPAQVGSLENSGEDPVPPRSFAPSLHSGLTAQPLAATASPGVSGPGPEGKARILFLPFEITEWKQARHLAYPAQLGLEEGLAAHGVEVITLPMLRGLSPDAREAWLGCVRELCANEKFDQVWVELVHSEWTEDALLWLESVAPKRVGFLMESLRYDPEALKFAPSVRGRWNLVEHRLRFVTHVLAVDEHDAAEINRRKLTAAVWWPQAVPERCVRPVPDAAPDQRALFYGQLYGPRLAWLEHRELQHLLWRPNHSPEEAGGYPRLFDEVNRVFGSLLDRKIPLEAAVLHEHAEVLRRLRRASFDAWLSSLQNAVAVANLPSLFQGYAGRVYEAMAAGRPVVSWEVPNRPRTRELFAEGEEILFYRRDDPGSLAAQIRRLQQEPVLARSLAEKARARLLSAHTVEQRTRQILDWIETGAEPDFSRARADLTGQAAPFRAFPQRPNQGIDTMPATSLAPQCGELFLALGAAHLHVRDFPAASAQLNRAIALQPGNVSAQVELARAALRSDRWPEFEAAVARILESEADHREAWTLLADLCLECGLRAEAAEISRLVAQREPNDLASRVRLAAARLQTSPPDRRTVAAGRVRELVSRHLPHAASAVEHRLQSSGGGAIPRVARLGALGGAREHFRQGDLAAAWNEAADSIRVRPFHPEGLLLLAEIGKAAGDLPRARGFAERARQLAPAWKQAKRFLQSISGGKGEIRVPLPELPASLTPRAPRLTVCLIAKNEERFLGRCLESIQTVADQIVVVDTGSTDWTKQIAERFGAEVYSFPWNDDFSAARNAALERATGDWVLSLDADEELRREDLHVLRQEMAQPQVMAYRIPIVTVDREDEGCSYVPRLFRNAPGLFFVGRVHEQVFTSIELRRAEWGLENRFGRSTLLHYGYADEVMKERNKSARNLALLERAVEETPNDPNLVMNLGLELMRSGQPAAGLEQYWQAFRLLLLERDAQGVPELRETLLTQLSTHLLAAGRFQEVTEVLQTGPARAGGLTASMHFTLGLALMQLQQIPQAIQHLRRCLALRDQPALSPVRKEVRQGGPHHCLALCLKMLKQPREAASAFQAALKEAPESRPLRHDFAEFLVDTGQPVEALQVLHELTREKPEEPRAWVAGGQIALSRPDFIEFACDWTSEAIQRFPGEAQIFQQRVEALILHQDAQEALITLRRGCPLATAQLEAALVLCELLSGPGWSEFGSPETALSQEFLKWYRALIAWNASPIVNAINSRLARLREMLPSAARWLEQALLEANEQAAV
jgi:tetratricopeptide (TPR) repeat protein